MSEAFPPREYVGECSRCDREISIALPESQVESGQYVRVRCAECGQINYADPQTKP